MKSKAWPSLTMVADDKTRARGDVVVEVEDEEVIRK